MEVQQPMRFIFQRFFHKKVKESFLCNNIVLEKENKMAGINTKTKIKFILFWSLSFLNHVNLVLCNSYNY